MSNDKPNTPAAIEDVKSAPASSRAKRPAWWNDKIDASWNKSKAAALLTWRYDVLLSQKLEERLAEEALALGHGAREAYARIHAWGPDLEARLADDWLQLGHVGETAWEKVNFAVRHAWELSLGDTQPTPGGVSTRDTAAHAAGE